MILVCVLELLLVWPTVWQELNNIFIEEVFLHISIASLLDSLPLLMAPKEAMIYLINDVTTIPTPLPYIADDSSGMHCQGVQEPMLGLRV